MQCSTRLRLIYHAWYATMPILYMITGNYQHHVLHKGFSRPENHRGTINCVITNAPTALPKCICETIQLLKNLCENAFFRDAAKPAIQRCAGSILCCIFPSIKYSACICKREPHRNIHLYYYYNYNLSQINATVQLFSARLCGFEVHHVHDASFLP